MQINLDNDAMASIASAAIFDSLSEETRDDVVKQAIQGLLTPEKTDRWSTAAETPLQKAFNQAVRDVAFKVVREKIQEDPQISAAILEMLGPLLTSALDAEAKEYSFGLSEHLGDALGHWLGEQANKNR